MRRRLFAAGIVSALGAAVLSVAAPATAQWSPSQFNADDLTSYQTNGVAWSTASTAGKVYVGGTFSRIRPSGSAAGVNETAVQNFATFDATSGAPTNCNLTFNNAGNTGTVRALNVSPNGSVLYVGGSFTTIGGSSAGVPVSLTGL